MQVAAMQCPLGGAGTSVALALPHLKGLVLVLQHLLHKVHQAIACGLRPDQRASKGQAAQPAMRVRRSLSECILQIMEC